MARIDCIVDTQPMAEEIKSVSHQINDTTTAVVAMKAAIVLAEQQAADMVCRNVNKGFYTLMRSQISQKIAKLQSEVDSQLMQLNTQRKQLLAIKNRMERNYNMLSDRYLKLFNGINQNLKQRILELDRPVFNFAVQEVEKVSNRTKYLAATVPISQLESLITSQQIVISNIKYRAEKVIESMTNFLANTSEQKKLSERVLLKNEKVQNTTLLIPILVCESNFDSFDNKKLEVIVSKEQLNTSVQSAMKNTLNQHLEQLVWNDVCEPHQEVKSEFSKMLATSNTSQRVKDMANKLFIATHFQTIKNEQL